MNDTKCFCIDREEELEERIAKLENVVEAAENLTGQQLYGNKAFSKYWMDLKEALEELGEPK